MLTELMIFAAFYAVAFVAHFIHTVVSKREINADNAHRFALYATVIVKAFQLALHDYALHLAETAVHIAGH